MANSISLPNGDTHHLQTNDSTAPAVADYYWLGNGCDAANI
jgi:hypothetical protein